LSFPTSIGCFFLDTCVILSEILKENTPRIEKLKKDSRNHHIPCYISDSVKQEAYEKVQQTSNFVGDVVRKTIKYALENFRNQRNVSITEPMTSDDIKALEDLFSQYHSVIRRSHIGLASPVSLIEEWTISFLGEELDKGTRITIAEFLRELIKKLLELTGTIEDLYDELVTFQRSFVRVKSITLDSRIVIPVKNIGIHEPDCNHIASAIFHQTSAREKTVFVTLDFSSVLDKRDRIQSQLGIECCDPLYGLHHLM